MSAPTRAKASAKTPARTAPPARSAPRGIVSSSHLVSPRSVELSEFEFGLIVAWNAFSRWAMRCMAAAGCPDLTITDVLVLHHINHRARNKKLADICFVLNYEDTHVVAYSLKKLVAAGLAQGDKQGKEVFYSPTPAGEAAVAKWLRSVSRLSTRQVSRTSRYLATAASPSGVGL